MSISFALYSKGNFKKYITFKLEKFSLLYNAYKFVFLFFHSEVYIKKLSIK